ncbi:phospholipid phosphatase-related protein type 5 [Apteryx rowi]|uniref:phospholipid phosphatase-related protein type 5 n=1 Tax=Apteryx rowi TaxID=308060 RepID=UPI000E1C940F|nr:phospholipid phosphatase-related protein type 5 [Apteryx rowi]
MMDHACAEVVRHMHKHGHTYIQSEKALALDLEAKMQGDQELLKNSYNRTPAIEDHIETGVAWIATSRVNMISNIRHQSQTSYLMSLCFILVEIIVGETAVFCLQLATKDFENQEKTILTGDCCYINPLVRRTIRFLGIYAFGLFATDIFVNAGQVVTGNLAPHFLALCKPNYTALGCKQYTQFISSVHACTGNPDLILKARKTFPSKEAALSVYAAMYLAMYVTNTVKARGTRLAKPVLCLGLMCLAFLTGINRVAEYRNHWSDVIAGFLIGISIAVFLVVCVVNNFRGRQPEHEHSHMDNLAQMPMISIPRVESPLEKNHITAFAEVT